MKRLLMLLPSVPDPPDAGAKLRNLGLLRLLGQQLDVDAIAFGSPRDAPRLSALARRATVIVEPPHRRRPARLKDILTSDLPDMALRRWSSQYAAAVKSALQSESYDLVQAEGIEMAPYLALATNRQRVYDAHNAEFLLQARASASANHPAGRLYSRIQAHRLERYERAVVRASQLTLAVSEHDANQLLALTNYEACVRVVPNGIDVSAYPFEARSRDAAPTLLVLGKLDFRPNVEATRWLVEHVLPRLFETLPRVRLFVVGASPPGWLVKGGQQDDRIAVTGYVPDERPYLARSTALALSVQTGGGARLKALVAMASGLPIVSTRVGMEGLEAVADEHYLEAHRIEAWTRALCQVLTDAELRQRLAKNARKLVEDCYDWAAIAPAVERAYTALK